VETVYESIRSLWLLWLIILFLAIVAWAFWPSRKRRFERDAEIPFREDGEKD